MLTTILLALLSVLPNETLLSDILNDRYAPVTLNSAYIDSVLNGANPDRLVLRYDNRKNLFRRSWEADWYMYDTKKQSKLEIGHGRDAQLSPNGKYVVYAKDNALWIYKVDFGTQVVMTHEDSDSILCGASDWLYEEEFDITRMFAFSPDSRQVAFIRLDTRNTGTYAWQEYLNKPMEQILAASTIDAPSLVEQSYPMTGTANPRATLCVYDIQNKGITQIPLTTNPEEDFYLPRLTWRTLPPAKQDKKAQPIYELLVQKVNRDQTKMELIACNPKSAVTRTIYRESSDEYFQDFSLFDNYQYLPNGQMLILSERDGYRRLYLHEADGTPLRCLTLEKMDLTQVYGMDAGFQTVYFQAAPTPMTRQVYALPIKKGNMVALTTAEGTHQITLSKDRTRAIDCFQSVTTPHQYTLYQLIDKGLALRPIQVLEDNRELQDTYQSLGLPEKEFFSFTTKRGDQLNGWRLLPKNMEKGKKYPVVVLQYSGPQSQRVLNRWRVKWEYYLVSAGYVVYSIDPRGTDCRGRDFRNQTYMSLGTKEAEDLQSLAKEYLAALSYIDTNRLILGGWSYGGYQTIRTMMEPDNAYRCGFAVAPVTDWRLYDTGYTERYMRRPQVNEYGYQTSSLLNRAKDLNGRLLLISGMADDNVHPENTWLLIEALVQAGKQFDMQLYPDDNHFLKKRNNYLHLHQTILNFLDKNL